MSIVHVEFATFRSSGAVCEDDESNEFGIIRGVSWKNCVSPKSIDFVFSLEKHVKTQSAMQFILRCLISAVTCLS